MEIKMKNKFDLYKLQDELKKYRQGHKEYQALVDIAIDNLKEFDTHYQKRLIESIKLRKAEEYKIFCKSAKYLYKNRDEIIKSGFGYNVIDFLEFNYANKIYLKDLLNAWEEGLTWIDEDEECLVIGVQCCQFDSNHQVAMIKYLKTNEEKIILIPRKDYDNWFYHIKPMVDNTKLSEDMSDFDDYHTLMEIPARFLNIEEW